MWCQYKYELMCGTLSDVCVMCVVAMGQNIDLHSSYKLCWECNEACGEHSEVCLFIRYIVDVCVKVCWSAKQWFQVVQKLWPCVWGVWWIDVWLCLFDAHSLFGSTEHDQTTNNITHNERTHLEWSQIQLTNDRSTGLNAHIDIRPTIQWIPITLRYENDSKWK